MEKYKISLSSIPETMLFTLHNRVREAKRPDGILIDPEAIHIYEMLDFDFTGNFGISPHGEVIAARAAYFDKILIEWLKKHPNGCVVSLGEGLETQSYRVDNGIVSWISVDLPEAITLREKLIPQKDRSKCLSQSAFDLSWIDQVDASHGVFIVVQGLFMYFEESNVQQLISEIFRQLPKAHLLFDFVSQPFVKKTQKGLQITEKYRLPPMAWGVSHKEIKQKLHSWLPYVKSIQIKHYDAFIRGLPHIIVDRFLRKLSFVGNHLPGIVYISN